MRGKGIGGGKKKAQEDQDPSHAVSSVLCEVTATVICYWMPTVLPHMIIHFCISSNELYLKKILFPSYRLIHQGSYKPSC